jgi:hypothetical protein
MVLNVNQPDLSPIGATGLEKPDPKEEKDFSMPETHGFAPGPFSPLFRGLSG